MSKIITALLLVFMVGCVQPKAMTKHEKAQVEHYQSDKTQKELKAVMVNDFRAAMVGGFMYERGGTNVTVVPIYDSYVNYRSNGTFYAECRSYDSTNMFVINGLWHITDNKYLHYSCRATNAFWPGAPLLWDGSCELYAVEDDMMIYKLSGETLLKTEKRVKCSSRFIWR